MASAVAYDRADTSGDVSNLWQTPGDAVYATSVSWTVGDSTAGELLIEVPSFGLTHRAVLVVISAADARTPDWAGSDVTEGYLEALGYRMDIGVTGAALDLAPRRLSSGGSGPSDWMTWSPASDEVAYSDYDPAVSEYSQIYRRRLDGTPAERVFVQPMNQFHPDWSPRGDNIVWATFPGTGQMDLWVEDINTVNFRATRLVSRPGVSTMPAFQPNGQGVAYIHEPASGSTGWELRWIGLDRTGDRLIKHFPYPAPGVPPLLVAAPRWTPDGTHLIVCDHTTRRLLRVPADGGPAVELPGRQLDFTSFDVPPAGGRLAVTIDASRPNWGLLPADPFCGLFGPPPPASILARSVALCDTAQASTDTTLRFVALGATARNLRWSPDGTKIAYSLGDSGSFDTEVWAGRVTLGRAPVFASSVQSTYSVPNCIPFELSLAATDADGDAITYEAYYLPAGASLQAGHHVFWPYPVAGEYWIVARALDPGAAVAAKVIKLDVFDAQSCGGGGGEEDPPILPGGGNSIRHAEQNRLFGGISAPVRVANTLLDGAEAGAWVSQTARLFAAQSDSLGNVIARLVGRRPGVFAVDRARLLVVDHWPQTVAVATADGIAVGSKLWPAHAALGGGEDLASALRGASGGARLLPAGSVVAVEWPQGETVDGLVLDCARASAPASGTAWGVRVEAGVEGDWQPVGRILPRSGYDALAVDLPTGTPVRLVVESDTYVRDLAGYSLAEPHAALATLTEVALSAADDYATQLAAADAAAVELAQGQRAMLRFAGPPPVADRQRTLFLDMVASFTPEAAVERTSRRETTSLPTSFALHGNQPNPFGGGTTMRFDVPRPARVRLEVFDAQGRRVQTLADDVFAPGTHAVAWAGTDANGHRVRPGVYLYRLTADGFRDQRRMVLLGR